jgi:hypothetical protein
MNLKEITVAGEVVGAGYTAKTSLEDQIRVPNAVANIRHSRPTRWDVDSNTGDLIPAGYVLVDEQTSTNLKTNAGMDFLHLQGYGTTGLGANGLNFIALSNDALSETVTSTTLSSEITTNGLARAQGTVSHTAATTTTTIDKTFTCTTAPQAAQKAALFTASSAGTMNHVLAFTQRSLQIGDTLQITYTITLS